MFGCLIVTLTYFKKNLDDNFVEVLIIIRKTTQLNVLYVIYAYLQFINLYENVFSQNCIVIVDVFRINLSHTLAFVAINVLSSV